MKPQPHISTVTRPYLMFICCMAVLQRLFEGQDGLYLMDNDVVSFHFRRKNTIG